jgi:hypothetical protein
MQNQVAIIGTGRNVEKGQFIRTLVIVAARYFDRISRVPKSDKIDALDNPSVGYVKAGDNTLCKTHTLKTFILQVNRNPKRTAGGGTAK